MTFRIIDISILSVFSKLLEKLMCNRLISFVVKNKVFLEAQNGFGEKKSTETASQLFIESIQEALDKGVHAIGLFFDLSRAYDVINNDLLLDKLNSYGIRGKTYSWFKSYLTQHVQFVERNQTDHKRQNRTGIFPQVEK